MPDAAARLGISEGAARKRIARGTLPHERDQDGSVWVLLDSREDAGTQREDTGHPPGQDRTQELIEELQDRVRSLEEANRENRRIIAALTSRIPELEAGPQSPSQPTEEASPTSPPTGPAEDATQEPQPAQRPWWRRMFGG